ncbi:hypothetical protein HQQ94_18110 [Shewanella sp. VB17]|uniref:hypothetical protein n=1 Tax=Shewanella sp. VB17 TaxID=2739432 RepID=UPI001564B011|nr:hypothetical protein [Shewanella sp. VB17]NRD75097.1 hypothetical protein [Shewanella sp. VB17]
MPLFSMLPTQERAVDTCAKSLAHSDKTSTSLLADSITIGSLSANVVVEIIKEAKISNVFFIFISTQYYLESAP